MYKQTIMTTLHSQLASRYCGTEYYQYISHVKIWLPLHMVKGTQDGETFQQKKIQEIFSDENIMCVN